jgi:hypothetical protein
VWFDAACAGTALPDPGYVATSDPSPATAPLVQRVGALHEHSSYSDGDPSAIPADYFAAGRTGHNVADAGGDTGVKLDFMFSSEHSDNTQIPITTAAVCVDPASGQFLVDCFQGLDMDHYWKWPATLRQAREGTAPDGSFTAARGFEWTNDYFNHLGVYFSTNFSNVKVDGSYASMDFFWDWIREPVTKGGGADGLVVFNHPGGDPHLTPFDAGFPHTKVLAQIPGGGNWNDLAYVPDMDGNVAGMEVNSGDDIEWYVKALAKGWHIGAVAAEDEHQREWATSSDGKTLIFTRGTSARDYYWAMKNHRTIAVRSPLVRGAPGSKAIVPTIEYWANGPTFTDAASVPLGSTVTGPGPHALHIAASGLTSGSRVALVGNRTQGQSAPIQLGAVAEDGSFAASHTVVPPSGGEDWYFAVVCPPAATSPCGSDQNFTAVTAPIWFAAPPPQAPSPSPSGGSLKVKIAIDLRGR